MTQASELTSEELMRLAEIAGIDVYTDDGTIWVPLSRPGTSRIWFPVEDWQQLGMVIEGMAARGRLLWVGPWHGSEGQPVYMVSFEGVDGYLEARPDMLKAAICRAALAATKKENADGTNR